MDEYKQFLKKLIARREFRKLGDVEKAVKLNKEYGTSQEDAAAVCGVSRNQLRKGKKAVEEGRDVGVVGRPTLLNPKEEEQLVALVKENVKKNTPLKYLEFKDAVCTPLPFFV
jgi:transposase